MSEAKAFAIIFKLDFNLLLVEADFYYFEQLISTYSVNVVLRKIKVVVYM